MGNSTPSADARSIREILKGLNRFEQHPVAYQWALQHDKLIDMFGAFARERHLLVFQSGNEHENWIDPFLNIIYKMNILTHSGGDILKILDKVNAYNEIFPELPMRFVGFHAMSSQNVYPVFAQQYISHADFADQHDIDEFIQLKGFSKCDEEGAFLNNKYILTDIKPKNVLCSDNGTLFVIDAEIKINT